MRGLRACGQDPAPNGLGRDLMAGWSWGSRWSPGLRMGASAAWQLWIQSGESLLEELPGTPGLSLSQAFVPTPALPYTRLVTGLAQPVAIKIQNSPSWSLRILPQDRARRPPCWDLFVYVFERGCLQGAARTRGRSLWCWERYCKRAVDLDFPLIFRVSIYLLVKRG